MSGDRTPASPVEVLAEALRDRRGYPIAKLMDGDGSSAWSFDPIGAYLRWEDVEAVLAALQAQDHTITKGGLRCASFWNGCVCARKPHDGDGHVWLNTLNGDLVDPALYPATNVYVHDPRRTGVHP